MTEFIQEGVALSTSPQELQLGGLRFLNRPIIGYTGLFPLSIILDHLLPPDCPGYTERDLGGRYIRPMVWAGFKGLILKFGGFPGLRGTLTFN